MNEQFDLHAMRRAQRRGAPFSVRGIDVVFARILGKNMRFAVDMENDPIQRRHRKGIFYEMKELNALLGVFPLGGVFVDIGANVGNHSLFAARYLGASRVIPFEPNPRAYKLLMTNVLLNDLGGIIDTSHLGFGLADKEEGGYGMRNVERNLGGADMVAGEGDLVVKTGDEVLARVTPSFIKIDVEGMEMRVLAGLEKTIARAKPVLLVEVDVVNDAAFAAWTEAAGYDVARVFQRYATNKNYMIRPRRTKRAAVVEEVATPKKPKKDK